MAKSGQAPTGCYKCGRPGHWSRDCPSTAPTINSNSGTNSGAFSFNKTKIGGASSKSSETSSSQKPKKLPKTRPKLTPELLLSDDGLGYILRHFPRSFKYRGRRHEVSDLGNLIGLYTEWHSRLLPYYSFDQFVQKVEQVGATKRVKMCIRDLRERVAKGGDPTKLDESYIEQEQKDINLDGEGLNSEQPECHENEPSTATHEADCVQEDMLQEIYEKATEESAPVVFGKRSADDMLSGVSSLKEAPNRGADEGGSSHSIGTGVTEVQRARMEANRIKALEKAAARVRSQPENMNA